MMMARLLSTFNHRSKAINLTKAKATCADNYHTMKLKKFCLLVCALFLSGCIGIDIPPRVFAWKPFSLLRGSEQVGRDQIANRFLVAKKVLRLDGFYSNEVLTLIGQPQKIRTIETGISEDWLYNYFKINPKDRMDASEGTFCVRVYKDKVLDVVPIT